MDIFDGIYNYLAAKTLLTALIGSPPNLYIENAPQSIQYPFVVFTCHDTDRETHLKGASAIGDFYIGFDVYAANTSDRQSISDALRNLLHTRTNVVITDSSANSVYLEYCECKRDMTGNKPLPDGSEQSVLCRTMNFRMVIDEPKPTLP